MPNFRVTYVLDIQDRSRRTLRNGAVQFVDVIAVDSLEALEFADIQLTAFPLPLSTYRIFVRSRNVLPR